MKSLILAFLFSVMGVAETQAQEKLVVLVPGFFNFPGSGQVGDSRPSYFSQTILSTIRAHGYQPVIIDTLNPVGSLEENSDRLAVALTALQTQHPQAEFTTVAHSAGGLYMAQVLTQHPDWPFHTVVTIATPYTGVRLVDLLSEVPGFGAITSALNLRAVSQFKSRNMPGFLKQIHLPVGIRWIALGGAQPVCFLLTCSQAEYLSWLVSTVWQFAHVSGDGVVSVASARAQGLQIQAQGGAWAEIERWDLVLPLEHWKQTLDPEVFHLLGISNTEWIAQQQQAMYSTILSRL